jgi:hypothetical protein
MHTGGGHEHCEARENYKAMDFWRFIGAQLIGWHLVLIVSLALGTRILPRLFCPEARGFDAFFHLIAARGIRLNRFRIPGTWKEYLLPGIYDYPPLYLYLLALFPVKWHPIAEKWSSAVFDAVHAVVVYLLAIYWLGMVCSTEQVASLALWVVMLFLFSPALTSVGTGPRAYQGTPRTLGELQFTLAMAAAVCFRCGEGDAFFVIAAFFGGCLFLTSKFGIQVYLFFHLFLAVVDANPIWILFVLAGFLAALLLSLGHYLVVAKGHWEHSRYYRAVIAPRFHMVKNFNRWEDIRNLLRNLFRNPRQAAQTLLMHNSYTQLLIKHPQLVYLGYLLAFAPGAIAVHALMLGWIGAGLSAFLLTSLKPFRFLGEADRYLEYTLVPQLLLLASAAAFRDFAPVLLVYELVWYAVFVGIFIFRFSQDAKRLPAFRELVEFIRSRDDIQRLLPIYLGEANQLAYDSSKGVLHFPANFRKRFFPYAAFTSLYEKVYPFPAEDLPSVMQRYRLDAVYYSGSDLRKAEANGIQYNFDGWVTVFSNAAYTVMQPPE